MVIDGNWQAVEAEINGQQIDEDYLSVITLNIEKDRCTIHIGGSTDSGTLKFIPHVVPMAFDVAVTDGPSVGKVFKAIYKYTGGYLIVCYNTAATDRPKTFLSTVENHYSLVRYKRMEA